VDLNSYWQENKRFVTLVVGGAVVFLIAYLLVGGKYEGAISAKRGELSRLEGDLRKSHYSGSDLDAAETENEALKQAAATLAARTDFEPRPPFGIDRAPGAASAGSQYLRALTEVRDTLIPRANRANMKLDPGLGMPALSPTRDDQIERYLEALDVVDTVANLAITCGVSRIERIAVRPDPGLSSRQGVGEIERTQIQFSFEGPARPLTELLARTQRPPDGRALLVGDVEMIASKAKAGDARLDLTIVAARLHEPAAEEEDL
jgi:hypothetical protein